MNVILCYLLLQTWIKQTEESSRYLFSYDKCLKSREQKIVIARENLKQKTNSTEGARLSLTQFQTNDPCSINEISTWHGSQQVSPSTVQTYTITRHDRSLQDVSFSIRHWVWNNRRRERKSAKTLLTEVNPCTDNKEKLRVMFGRLSTTFSFNRHSFFKTVDLMNMF